MKNLKLKLISVCAISAMMAPTGALAVDAQDFAERLSETVSTLASFQITFDDAQMDGNNVVINGLNISNFPGTDGDENSIDTNIVFTNVVETEFGGYRADQAQFENIDMNKDGIHLIVSDIVVEGIELFSDSESNVLSMMKLYQRFSVGPISVDVENENVFRVEGMAVTAEWNEDDTVMRSDYDITGIYGNLSKIDETEFQEMISVFDLSEITASMVGRSTWALDEGRFSIEESSITVDKIGRLNITGDIVGYTLALAEKVQQMARDMNELEAGSEQFEMQTLQMLMSLAADLSIDGFNIRFDDDSITYKIMDFIGEEEGLSRKGMISTIAQILPMALSELDMPELQAEITEAVIAFLRDPQSIEIDASPNEAVPVMGLMAVAQNPSIAKDLLGLSVSANQPE
ncbi:MAG: hypothetical protein L3J13_03885 [Devosiaceae bacterium]|nr:hypothetical protein [Devosiaceae bacterium]